MSAGPMEGLCILYVCSTGYKNVWRATTSLCWQYGAYIWMQALYVECIGHGDDGFILAMMCIHTTAFSFPLDSALG